MRFPRIKEENGGYYHILSRIVDRRMVLDEDEKERFRRMMRETEAFSGCEVLTYAILSNHWHILLYVPPRQDITDTELIRRLGLIYDPQPVKAIEECLSQARDGQAAEAIRAKFKARMYDLSEFAKTLKQRFTQSFNRRHGRKGTLWEERLKSVLIGGSQGALSAVAAYIDLNPIRAGMAQDPKDYRFCGYGEAVGGYAGARKGIGRVMLSMEQSDDWEKAAANYRQLLYMAGEARGLREDGRPMRPGFSAEEVKAVIKDGGELPLNTLLRCRVRYFTDGVVLGSRAFVDDAFARYRSRFSPKRTSGARSMLGGESWGDLCTVRRLRVDVISTPTPA